MLKSQAIELKTSSNSTKIDCNDVISEYIFRSDWRVNANANSDYSNAGLINNCAGKIIANYWLDTIYNPKKVKRIGKGIFISMTLIA